MHQRNLNRMANFMRKDRNWCGGGRTGESLNKMLEQLRTQSRWYHYNYGQQWLGMGR